MINLCKEDPPVHIVVKQKLTDFPAIQKIATLQNSSLPNKPNVKLTSDKIN